MVVFLHIFKYKKDYKGKGKNFFKGPIYNKWGCCFCTIIGYMLGEPIISILKVIGKLLNSSRRKQSYKIKSIKNKFFHDQLKKNIRREFVTHTHSLNRFRGEK